MIVGTDTYITMIEADSYIRAHYRGSNKNYQRWAALEDPDKTVLLLQACAEIEQLPFVGRKAVTDQPMAFPRLPQQYGHTDEGAPAQIRAAQAELALWLSDDDGREAADKRQELQAAGVKSFGIGDLSESYEGAAADKPVALQCPKAKARLLRYINGGFSLC